MSSRLPRELEEEAGPAEVSAEAAEEGAANEGDAWGQRLLRASPRPVNRSRGEASTDARQVTTAQKTFSP
jgi:hypothetical protein